MSQKGDGTAMNGKRIPTTQTSLSMREAEGTRDTHWHGCVAGRSVVLHNCLERSKHNGLRRKGRGEGACVGAGGERIGTNEGVIAHRDRPLLPVAT